MVLPRNHDEHKNLSKRGWMRIVTEMLLRFYLLDSTDDLHSIVTICTLTKFCKGYGFFITGFL